MLECDFADVEDDLEFDDPSRFLEFESEDDELEQMIGQGLEMCSAEQPTGIIYPMSSVEPPAGDVKTTVPKRVSFDDGGSSDRHAPRESSEPDTLADRRVRLLAQSIGQAKIALLQELGVYEGVLAAVPDPSRIVDVRAGPSSDGNG